MGYTVAVLTGGTGTELELSRAGAHTVCAALEKFGHRAVELACDEGLAAALRAQKPDAAWPVLPGGLGESGTVTELLEALGIPCVGSPSTVCRRLNDKRELVRTVAEAAELRTLDARMPHTVSLGAACLRDMGGLDALDLVLERIPGGLPVAVKPACGTGGAGVRKVEDAQELRGAVEAALAFDDTVLVQEWVDGVEVTVCVLGSPDDLQVMPPVELCANGERHTPVRYASLNHDHEKAQAVRSAIDRAAIDAFLACGCRGAVEVDLVWDGAEACILDVNAAPRIDDRSLLVLTAEQCEIGMDELADALVACAVEE